MGAEAPAFTRESLVEAVVSGYFGAMDAGDVEACVACFADDAVLLTENRMRLEGKEELRAFFARLVAISHEMLHEVTNLVVDVDAGKVACELRYANTRREGGRLDMANCNFFDFDPSGRFTRVKFWLGDPSQLERGG